MPITLPSFVAPNELIQSAWGNGVVNALDELDDEKLNNNASDEMAGTLTVNAPASGTSVILKAGDESPRLRFQSQAGTDLVAIVAGASSVSLDTLSNNPFLVFAPTTIESSSGSTVLSMRAVTETPVMRLISMAGTGLLTFTAGVATSTIEAFDDMMLRTNGADALAIDGATQRVRATAALEIDGALDHDGTTVGFYGTAPVAKQTGVAVSAAGVHAALVNLGLIT